MLTPAIAAIAIFILGWYVLHKIFVWYTARPKVLFRPAAIYKDPTGTDTLDSRDQGE